MRKMLVAAAAATLCACGGNSSSVSGDVKFDVAQARAFRVDSGAGTLPVIEVVLASADFECSVLTDQPTDGGYTTPPFAHAVVVEYVDHGARTYTVPVPSFFGPPDAGDGVTDIASVQSAELFADSIISTSGSVVVSSQDGSKTKGSFDTTGITEEDFFNTAFGGGHVDATGTAFYADGGAAPKKALKGDFEADFCP